jgi:hypothetical protein
MIQQKALVPIEIPKIKKHIHSHNLKQIKNIKIKKGEKHMQSRINIKIFLNMTLILNQVVSLENQNMGKISISI